MEDGLFLYMNLKMTPEWAWPGLRELMWKFWDPLMTGKTSKVNHSVPR